MESFVLVSFLVTSGYALMNAQLICPDLSTTCKPATCKAWSYEGENGPSHWSSVGFSACGLTEQSPIKLDRRSAAQSKYKPIRFDNGYIYAIDGTWLNDGETVRFTPQSPETLSLTGGVYGNDVYQLAQFHFHWGCRNNQGSEHIINGARNSLELHLVHWKKSYGSFANAVNFRDGLAVIGFLFKANPFFGEFKDLFRNFGCARDTNTNTTGSIHLYNILSQVNRGEFFTYKGSLTTPPCSQIVIWTVLTTVIDIHNSEIQNLRKLDNCHCEPICDNFRPTQPIGSRVVHFNNPPIVP